MPTVVIGDNTGDDFAGTEDTMIQEGSPTANFGTNVNMEISNYSSGNHTHNLVSFSGLSNISGPVTVSSVIYGLNINAQSSTTSRTASFYRVLRNWVENSVTWNAYDGTNSWTTGGATGTGDSVASASGTMTLGVSTGYHTSTNAGMASDVEGWINGTYSNYGWLGVRTDGADDTEYDQITTTDGTTTFRPYLSVTYTTGGSGTTIVQLAGGGGLAGPSGLAGPGGLAG